MQDSPELATSVGHPGQNARWADRSLEAQNRRVQENARHLKELRSFDPKKLNARERLYWRLTERSLEDAKASLEFKEYLLPLSQMWGVQSEIPQTLALNPKSTVQDLEAMVARVAAIPKLLSEVRTLLEEGIKQDILYPKVAMEKAAAQLKELLAAEGWKNPVLEPFQNLPASIPAKEKERIQKQAEAIFSKEVRPAFVELQEYFVQKYLPRCGKRIAWTEMPQGKKWYAFKVRQSTTTSLSPDEIHSIGLKEVARIREAMSALRKQTGFSGSPSEFSNFLKTDKRFFYNSADELIRGYRDLAKRIDPQLPLLFGKLPRLTYGVQPIPEFAAPSQPTAYYQPGSPAAGRGGTFFANTYDLKSRPKWEMEALTAHEAVPGHHLQMALAQEMEGVPEFRKNDAYNAFVEGWALYSESLGTELGLYQDPYSDYGRLTYEMWRSIRLVVDTGIHAKGWSREKAISFFSENASKSDHDIEQEVDRYLVMPAQALGYKIGQLRILALRAAEEKRLGPKFHLRKFHDRLLEEGALPLDILEEKFSSR